MNKKEIISRLKNDEDYYGSFGKQYLSNSDIQTLLSNPLALHKDRSMSSAERKLYLPKELNLLFLDLKLACI